jgi:hypothetical protein
MLGAPRFAKQSPLLSLKNLKDQHLRKHSDEIKGAFSWSLPIFEGRPRRIVCGLKKSIANLKAS